MHVWHIGTISLYLLFAFTAHPQTKCLRNKGRWKRIAFRLVLVLEWTTTLNARTAEPLRQVYLYKGIQTVPNTHRPARTSLTRPGWRQIPEQTSRKTATWSFLAVFQNLEEEIYGAVPSASNSGSWFALWTVEEEEREAGSVKPLARTGKCRVNAVKNNGLRVNGTHAKNWHVLWVS